MDQIIEYGPAHFPPGNSKCRANFGQIKGLHKKNIAVDKLIRFLRTVHQNTNSLERGFKAFQHIDHIHTNFIDRIAPFKHKCGRQTHHPNALTDA